MKLLAYVGDFIRSLHRDLSPGVPEDSTGLWFSWADEGSLLLSAPETKEYKRIVSRLFDQFVKREDMSRRAVERYLQEALFVALDLQSRRGLSFEQRLDNAVAQL